MTVPTGGGSPLEIFRPLRYTPEQARRFGEFDYPTIVRLAPGVSAEQSRPELTALTREAFGEVPFAITPIVTPLDLQITGDVRAPLGWLLAAVGAVLLVACVNVASLLSARGLAVRSALGGGDADLVRHVLAESALLATIGGAVGVGVSRVPAIRNGGGAAGSAASWRGRHRRDRSGPGRRSRRGQRVRLRPSAGVARDPPGPVRRPQGRRAGRERPFVASARRPTGRRAGRPDRRSSWWRGGCCWPASCA